MATNTDTVSEKVKNTCAINTMIKMLMKYSERNNVSFEDAMLQFARSSTYETLFDFETAVWKEGPDYLLELYKDELHSDSQAV